MNLHCIAAKHVQEALRRIDREGIPAGRQSRKFLLHFEGRDYPPKYVVSLAYGLATGVKLDSEDFSGGEQTNGLLRRLGFEIVLLGRPVAQREKTPNQSHCRPRNGGQGHTERCPRCKEAVLGMLRRIYGGAVRNHKVPVSTDVRDFKGLPCHRDLQTILAKLQQWRGFKDFVDAPYLHDCDFFVPDPGFVVEFDESQHFTAARKRALQHYPSRLATGFPLAKWVRLCETLNRSDNDPRYRDEQRAWYDTLRDFLPEIAGLKPTVRLYAKDLPWCSLNPEDPSDVSRFQRLIERSHLMSRQFVAVVLIESNENYSTGKRRDVLAEVCELVARERAGDGVILFPGGWFKTGPQPADRRVGWVEKEVSAILRPWERRIVVCVGIDGRTPGGDDRPRDQFALAVSRDGMEAMARKFFPAPGDAADLKRATNHVNGEHGHDRIFELNGTRYYPAVCYDVFGVKKLGVPNPGVDVVLGLIHGFWRSGEGPSGAPRFARLGLAGASKAWACPVFGAAGFFHRPIQPDWPSGVLWNQGSKSPQNWLYEDNPVKCLWRRRIPVEEEEGNVEIRTYDVGSIL